MGYIDLITDEGQLVKIEYDDKFEDQIHEAVDNARRCGDWFSIMMFNGTSIDYMGLKLERINMKKIIGTL